MRPSASPIAVWAGLIVLYLVWGSTYLGIKVAIDTIPPFLMGFLRFVPAGILLAGAIAFVNRRTIRRPTRRETIDTAIVGTFLLLGGMGLVAWAEQTIPSGIAALLIALMPMWLAIFGLALLGERLPRAGVIGIAVGVVGVAILAWPTAGVDDLDPAGLLALLISPICWALGSIYAARRAVLPAPALFATGLEMVAGGLALLIAGAVVGELATFDVAAVSAESWGGLLYLLFVGSLVGYTTFAWLLTVAPLLARRDLRLREPRRRRDPRRPDPRRAAVAADAGRERGHRRGGGPDRDREESRPACGGHGEAWSHRDRGVGRLTRA